MSAFPRPAQRLRALAAALYVAGAGASAALAQDGATATSAAAEPPRAQDAASALDDDAPYRYRIIEADLRTVLQDFGSNVGVLMNIDDRVRGRVSGQLPELAPRAFLRRLGELYNFVAFFDGDVIHVTPASANAARLIVLERASLESVEGALEAAGVDRTPFALRAAADGTLAYAAGPPRFVALVEETVRALNARPIEAPAPPANPPANNRATPSRAPAPAPLVIFRGSTVEVLPNGRHGR